LESQVIFNYGEIIYEFSVQKGQQKILFRVLHKGEFPAYKSIAVTVSTFWIQHCKSHKVFFIVFRKT
jgi:hypothetical protein